LAARVLRQESIDTNFALPINEMFDLLKSDDGDDIIIDKPNILHLNYLDLFKKDGQFQEEFKLTTDSFYNEIIGWHMRNLVLMKKFGVDTEQFNFHLN
jgi:hypothetical protein